MCYKDDRVDLGLFINFIEFEMRKYGLTTVPISIIVFVLDSACIEKENDRLCT